MIRTLLLSTVLSFSLPAFADHHGEKHDHDKMDHSEMDHSKMNHADTHDHDSGHDHAGERPRNLPADIEAALVDGGKLIQVDVLGMVCDFCATAMNKTFGKRDDVKAVYVDLDTKVLSVVTEGDTLDDETIKNLVKKAGYKTEAIRRESDV